jgi:periplasmic protein CpxP/Spy
MNPIHRRLALAAALAACAFASQAQTPPPGMPGPQGMQGMHGMHDGAGMHQRMQERMQEHHQRRMEGLKRILQLTPQQEGAWSAWAAAMRPAANMHRMNHDEMAQLTTPQRIDRMRQVRAQRTAEMDRKAEATKSFYAQLTPPQQKAFDEVSMRFMHRGHHGRHGG